MPRIHVFESLPAFSFVASDISEVAWIPLMAFARREHFVRSLSANEMAFHLLPSTCSCQKPSWSPKA